MKYTRPLLPSRFVVSKPVSRCRRRSISTGGVVAMLCVAGWQPIQAEPEFRKAQGPVSADLKSQRTATDSIGEVPDHLLDQYDLAGILPRIWLPKGRDKLMPKTGVDFVDEMRFEIRPRFYYFHRDIGGGGVQESAAWGGEFGLESGWWNDRVRIGLTGYTSQKLYGKDSRDGIGLLAPGQSGYTVLGEAYLDVKLSESLFRAGRTRVEMPYINGNDFRMTPHTYEAVGFRYGEIEHLKLQAGHIFTLKGQTSTDFESMSEAAGVVNKERGVSAFSVRYKFAEHSFLALSDQYGWDMFNTLYVEGEHMIEFSDRFRVNMGAQFTDQRSVGSELLGDFSGQSAAAKVELQYCNVMLALSYQWTCDDQGMVKPWGATPAYHSSIIQDFDRAGEESFRVGLHYDFEPHGLKGISVDTSWVSGNTPDGGKYASPDQDEFDFTIDYRPEVELFEGVWFRARYANNQIDGGGDLEDIRFILNYSYTF